MTDPKIIEEAKKPEPPKEETPNSASEPAAETAISLAAGDASSEANTVGDISPEEDPVSEGTGTDEDPSVDEEIEEEPPVLETSPEQESRLEPEADDVEPFVEAEAVPGSDIPDELPPELEAPVEDTPEAVDEAPETEPEPEAKLEPEATEVTEPEPEPAAEAEPEVEAEEAPEEPIVASQPIKKRTIVEPVIKPKSEPVEVQPVAKRTAVRALSSGNEEDGISIGGPQPVAKIGAAPIASGPANDGEAKPAISIRDLTRQSRESLAMEDETSDPNESSSVSAETDGAQRISLTPIAPKTEAPAPAATSEGAPAPDPHPKAVPIVSPQIKGPSISSQVTPKIRQEGDDDDSSASLPTTPSQSIRPAPAKELDPTDAATAKQQQMLQLEPLSKGRFAKTEPTIVDGEDMDVPTFLRKKRK